MWLFDVITTEGRAALRSAIRVPADRRNRLEELRQSAQGEGTTMLVRDARDGDMAQVQAINAHHVLHGTASFEEEPPPLAEMVRRRGEVLAKGLPFLVAEIDG